MEKLKDKVKCLLASSVGLFAGTGSSIGMGLLCASCSGLFALLGFGALASWLPTMRGPFLILGFGLLSFALYRWQSQRSCSNKGKLAAWALPIVVMSGVAIAARSIKGSPKSCALHPNAQSSQCCTSSPSELTSAQQKALGFIMASFIKGETQIGAKDVKNALNLKSIQEGRDLILQLHYGNRLLHYDVEQDRFLAVFPLSPKPTPIQVELADGRRIFAMCGYDALGVPALFKSKGTIHAESPVYGDPIRIELLERKLARISPKTSLLWISKSSGSWAERKCGETLFFTSKKELNEWRRMHPDFKGYAVNIEETVAQSVRRFAWLGELLDHAPKTISNPIG